MAKGKYEEWLTEDGLLTLEAWARNGLTDEQIASNMGVSTATLYNYKKKYLEILEALKRGKVVVDVQVENALFKRAIGYKFEEQEYIYVRIEDEDYFEELDHFMKRYKYEHPEATDAELEYQRLTFPREKRILVKSKTKEVAGDTTAQIFWLKNRMPEVWRDKQTIEHDGSVKINNPFAGLSEEELRRLANGPDSS